MALDDRDQNFEKALACHLRGAAQPAVCPDPEILAAYHQRTLSQEELNSWKQHIAGCAPCQHILALLETTEEIPVNAGPLESAVMHQAEPEFAGENEPMLHAPAASAAPAAVRSIARPKSDSQKAKPQRKASWVWLAPAGAIAAGLLVWIAVHQPMPAKLGETKPVQIADNRQPPLPGQVREAMPEAPVKAETKTPSVNTDTAMTSSAHLNPAGKVVPGKKKSLAPILADKLLPLEEKKEPGRTAVAAQAREADAFEKELSAGNRASDAAAFATRQDKSEMAPTAPLPAAAPMLAGRAAPATPPAAQEAAKQKSAVEMSAMPQTIAVTSDYKNLSTLRREAAKNPSLIPAPDGKAAWRVGPAGLIEFSSNAGKKWWPQISGVAADLSAGSAPSKKICWVIGHSGTVLLTIDGGGSWKQLASPISEDLGGVRALDALHATVWGASNHQSFETTDGGVTWSAVAHK